ncbi:MAG: protein-glutamine glutaminase family protein [Bacteriovoracaceae bacterium]
MKLFSLLTLALISFSAFAQNLTLSDFHYSLNDVLTRGQTKESLFTGLNRDIVKTGSSICSNRALLWTYDMKRFHNIDAAKIYVFYTSQNGDEGGKKWWYHVTPVINEKGQLWTIDGGFPGFVKGPMLISDWLKKFVHTDNCKQIRASEKDLLELMFVGRMFPDSTPQYGPQQCYTVIAPGMFWTPATVAMGVLQEDSSGRPIRFTREQYDMDEVLQACKEAAAGALGTIFGNPKKKCKEYLGIADD